MYPCCVSEVFAQLFLKSAYSLPSVEVRRDESRCGGDCMEEARMHLRHLPDDFLRRASKIRGYFDNPGAGTNGCAISEVLRRFFKSERNPCGGEYACKKR